MNVMLSSTDDLFAMQMLYRYADEGKCKFLGVVVDRQGEDYAALADVMNTYFGSPGGLAALSPVAVRVSRP